MPGCSNTAITALFFYVFLVAAGLIKILINNTPDEVVCPRSSAARKKGDTSMFLTCASFIFINCSTAYRGS